MKYLSIPATVASLVLATCGPAVAHGDHSAYEQVSAIEPIAYGQPGSTVEITEENGKRIIESNGIPNHRLGRFPNRDNPNSIRPQSNHFEMTLDPQQNATAKDTMHMIFGVAVNGVPFDPGTVEFWRNDPSLGWRMEAIVDGRGTLGIDDSNAHVQPTGAYHYHGIPNGLIDQLGSEGRMKLLGWAADGFPIYGPWAYEDPSDPASKVVEMKPSYTLKEGQRPGGSQGPGGNYDGTYTADFEYVEGSGTLDEANGREGVTPEYPHGTYYYALTETFPYVPRKFRGTPDRSFLHQPPGRRGPGGLPPRGGAGHRPPPPPPPPFM